MNYGYKSLGRLKDAALAKRLEEILQDFPADSYGRHPYVEVDGLYSGVRIRRITHLDPPTLKRLVGVADHIFNEVSGKKRSRIA